jgi:cytochrome P450
MPFGTGPRVCIGSHFALTEMTLIAAYLLQRFSFLSNAVPRPKLAVLLFPEGGIPLQLIRRTH